MAQASQLTRAGLGAEITNVDLRKPPQVIQGQSFVTLGSLKLLVSMDDVGSCMKSEIRISMKNICKVKQIIFCHNSL